MHSSGQSNKKLFADTGYKLFKLLGYVYQDNIIFMAFLSSLVAHKNPKFSKLRYINLFFFSVSLQVNRLSNTCFFFYSFRFFQIVMSFAQTLFERVSLAALFVSSSYRSLFLRHKINLTVHSREFPFLHLPFNDFIFTTMPSTFYETTF